jgi:hypothetical protein
LSAPEHRYEFISRSATSAVHGHPGVAALDFRLEVDSVRVGNNPVLRAGQSWYRHIVGGNELILPNRRALSGGGWVEPRGILLEYSSLADRLIASISDALDDIMRSIDGEEFNGWPINDKFRLVAGGPAPPWGIGSN